MASRNRKGREGPCSASAWEVIFHDEFVDEFNALDEAVQDELLAAAEAVELAGPKTGRPHVDTLNGSRHANMKELRFTARDGAEIWRAAFAFDVERRACILVTGAKQGKDEQAFYKRLIRKADRRFDAHLESLRNAGQPRDTGFGRKNCNA